MVPSLKNDDFLLKNDRKMTSTRKQNRYDVEDITSDGGVLMTKIVESAGQFYTEMMILQQKTKILPSKNDDIWGDQRRTTTRCRRTWVL